MCSLCDDKVIKTGTAATINTYPVNVGVQPVIKNTGITLGSKK